MFTLSRNDSCVLGDSVDRITRSYGHYGVDGGGCCREEVSQLCAGGTWDYAQSGLN